MIGEDAVNSTTAMLEKLMQIILEIIRMQRDSQRYNSREAAKSSKENAKQPKIKFGEMKKTEYKKMLNAGDKMHRIEVDKNQLEGLNKIAKEIGAKYWVMSTEGNTASVIVPEKFFVQMQGALEEATKLQLTKSPQSLAVHNGAEIISAEDIDMAKAVLSYHDIPTATFKTDGGYMNIVSSDFDGQYKAAMQEISRLKDELKNIDITVFEQTMPFEYINKLDTKIIEATQEMAQYIKLNVPEAELLRTESGEIAVKYPAASEAQIQNCITNYSNDIAAAQDYQAVIIDNTININRDKLLISENTSEYFTRVPNTAGQDYIKIAKDDSALTDGKTISAKIDYDKTYQIFDKDGNLKSELSGRDLAAKYNTKSRSANKKTDIRRYNNDSLDRIEVYNAKENKLVRIGIENADVVRKNLLDCGISPFAAEKLLADIDNSLSDDYKSVFKYNPPSIQNSFSEIKSDMLEQYKVAEKISSAQLVDGFNDTLGKKCCVFDKRINEYVLVPAQENRLKTALAQMGYDVLQTNVIVSEAQKSYSPSGATLEREDIHAQSFETGNAEVSAYKFCNDEHGIILIKQEITDTDVSIKYADINKDTTRPEIEKALKSEFHMQDAASIAELLNCMEKEQLISKAVSTITKDGFEISQVSSDYLKISKDSSTLMLDKNKVEIKQLSNAFGITEKQADKLSNSLSKSLKAADRKEKSQTLNDIKNAAKKAYEQLSDKKAQPSPEKKISAEFDRS
jgi:CRISPR/Cas system-associated protein endoribonuclease Cas2